MKLANPLSRRQLAIFVALAALIAFALPGPSLQAHEMPVVAAHAPSPGAVPFAGITEYVVNDRGRVVQIATVALIIGILILMKK